LILIDLGFLSNNDIFFSPLLLRVVMKNVRIAELDGPRLMINKTNDKQKIIEQLITLGLSHMTLDKFFEMPEKPRVEDAISNNLAFFISAYIENASVAPQLRGVSGRVDHVFNGDLNVAVKSVLESRDCDIGVKRITERCERFGDHKYPWEHNAVLNFNMSTAKVILPSKQCKYPIDQVYTYVHLTRQLFRGKSEVIVKGGVVTKILSPTNLLYTVTFSRFSTLVTRDAPRALTCAFRKLV
jgi:hypothetical protein